MVFQSIKEVKEALRFGNPVSARDLYAIWNRRMPAVLASFKDAPTKPDELRYLEWLQADMDTVIAFAGQALHRQEYLLVCDVYAEANAYWKIGERLERKESHAQMANLTSLYAQAKTKLGFANAARTALETWAHSPNLSAHERAKILLQMGNIVREQSHQSPDPTSRRVTAADALELYCGAVALDPDLLEGRLLRAAMLFVSSDDQTSRIAQARDGARDVLARIEKAERKAGPTFRNVHFQAIAASILGKPDHSLGFYAQLKNTAGADTASLADARYDSRLLAEAMGYSRRFFYEAFPPLQLLVFSGPDTSGLPADCLPQARAALREKLARLEAQVGLVSAAAGGDLLFIEAMQERPGASCHVVLPWSMEEFCRTSIVPYEPTDGPPIWEPLFRRALAEAATVRELGQVYEPDDDVGWGYTQEVIAGLALLTARTSRLDVYPVALGDSRSDARPSGTQSFIELWRQQLQREPDIINVTTSPNSLETQSPPHRVQTEQPSMHREVKSMLFADIVGYSKLKEKVIADFVGIFIQHLSVLLATSPHAPRCVNNWGDALYAVFDFSHDAGLFALALAKMVNDGADEWMEKGLFFLEHDQQKDEWIKRPLNIRIGLHTGPVLSHYNPVLRQVSYTGSHVSRAARIEPIAEPGEVYASEEFAAMAELGREIRRGGSGAQNSEKEGLVCEYAGSKALAKGYPGLFRIYRVIPERDLDIEALARAAHSLYCERQAGPGRTAEKNSSVGAWEGLSENLRDANRSQVTDIPNKLYVLGYELSPGTGFSPSQLVITAEQLELLSQREHGRWMAERQRQGWTLGPQRDDARREHPSMIPWESLSEEERQKDRDTVNNIPVLLKKANFQLRKIAS